MMISIVALLLLFGGAAVLGLIIFAIASKKLWILPVSGVLVAFALIAFGILPAIVLAPHRSVTVQFPSPTQMAQQVNGMAHTVVQGPPNFNAYVSGPNWSRILIFALLIAFLFGLVVRRGMSPGAGHGLRRLPAIAAILFIAVMFLRSVRSDYTVTQASNAATAVQHAAAEIQDIEQFDAPRIPIPPDVTSANAPKAPAAPAAPAQPTSVTKPTDKSVAKTNKDDAKKPAAAPNHKRKKPDATMASNDAKQAQPVAQSKPTDEMAAKKESATTSDKPVAAAEAEPEKPKARPAWVDESPKRTGNTLREVIATEPYATVDECYQAADVYLLLKTYQRMQELAGIPYNVGALPSVTFQNGKILADGFVVSYGRSYPYWADERIRALANMDIGTDYVRREIVAKDPKDNESREYIETVESSIGPMKKLHLQIEFTSAVDRELRRHWDAHARRERFATVGIGAGSILGLLGLVFGLLKMDTWTKGYYTKRLFIGVPAAIIAGFLLLVMLGTYHATYR